MTQEPLLLASDQLAGQVHLLQIPSGTPLARLERRHLSEHAGFLALPGGRRACVDERAGELLVLDPLGAAGGGPLLEYALPVAVPAEQLAADPTGRHLALTTGLGAQDSPWSELLTVIDLTTRECARVRTRPGEPGVSVVGGSDPLVVVRQREPGQLACYPHRELLAAAPGCPTATPTSTLPLPDDGHGDAQDPRAGRVFAATSGGVHRAQATDGTLVGEPTLDWQADGRGYFLRLDPIRRQLWSVVRGGPRDPARWSEWTNQSWCHRLDSERTTVTDLGPGLVFRIALTRGHAAVARIHPGGDELIVLTLDDEHPTVVRRVPLPAMDGAPRADQSPWEGVQRRALAGTSTSDWIAVTRGGHGEIELVDCTGRRESRRLRLPTPLDEGGRLAMIGEEDGAEGDPHGR